MSEHYVVVRESEAEDPKGSVHMKSFPQEGMARAEAAEKARARPGVRYSVYRRLDTCEASIAPAEWDEGGPDA